MNGYVFYESHYQKSVTKEQEAKKTTKKAKAKTKDYEDTETPKEKVEWIYGAIIPLLKPYLLPDFKVCLKSFNIQGDDTIKKACRFLAAILGPKLAETSTWELVCIVSCNILVEK